MRLAFHEAPIVLADDDRGTITYHPDAIDAETAQAWFAALRARVAWQSDRRRMYDRDVDVPRLTAHFALAAGDGLAATGGTAEPFAPAPIDAARDVAQRLAGAIFNAVGLNLYRDGSDSVAMHNDKLYRLEAGAPIALVSLGAARRMNIRGKDAPRRSLRIDLEPGSVLLMTYATQLHYEHGIPKTRAPVGPRISLAFRRLRAAALADVGAWR